MHAFQTYENDVLSKPAYSMRERVIPVFDTGMNSEARNLRIVCAGDTKLLVSADADFEVGRKSLRAPLKEVSAYKPDSIRMLVVRWDVAM